ncbi:regulatory protein GemA [Rhodoferax fermentans]|uniref:GemA protein n=1 Tax=Rhodoferax fermentans TaxID=28066 RepID=A0A1T1AP06_RHOFE|nr:regulatory protein GemA [Rhodoferax fermentans]MBK1683405.1 regulatory protein GemA [Rhodoferax fermentans]OOV05849.1 hypothetical protein RF819_03195 [Rhodoferax fermentans]
MSKAATDVQRKRELALIHLAKATLGLSRADYEHVLRTVTGETSAADLDAAGRDKLLKHFKAKGFQVKPTLKSKQTRTAAEQPQVRKLRAMWYALAEVGAVAQPTSPGACDLLLEAWAKRQLNGTRLGPLDALRFASGEQLNKLIEEMKAWGLRVGAKIK